MTGDAVLARLGQVHVHEDPDAVAEAAARMVETVSRQAVEQHGAFNVALAGGATPMRLYQLLAAPQRRDRVSWDAWRVFFGDERAVPPDDSQSNFRMVRESLLRYVPISSERVHRMRGERAPDAAAAEYHDLLAAHVPGDAAGVPQLDLVLLGLGENGHTASLFPGTAALEVDDRWATRGRADYAPYDRVTLTYPVLNAARSVAFLVTGTKKHRALHATAAGETPAARVRPAAGGPHWLLDVEAAGRDATPE